jgi:hypothetical protein
LDERVHVEADAVVLVEPREPNLELADALAARCGESLAVSAIGDCVQPRKLQDALLDAATLGARL